MPRRAARSCGLGRAFQLTNLFPNLTVLENVRLAVQVQARQGLDLFARTEPSRADRPRRWTISRRVARRPARGDRGALPHGDQRKLEVAILIALEPDIFMFDEPTAGMSVDEVPTVLDIIAAIKQRGDKTILLVEHKMDVVRSLADRIVVLHKGKLVADGQPAEVIASDIVREAYLGRSAAMTEPLLTPRGVQTHIGRYHILQGVELRRAARRPHRAARPQRRGQDDDAAHHHGPVAGRGGRDPLRRPGLAGSPTPDIARLRHRLCAGEHGYFRRPHGAREPSCSPRDPARPRPARLEWIFWLFPALQRFWALPAGALSGGQKQMLAIARAIIEPRELILVDEPTKGLAPAIVANMIGAFRELKAGGRPCCWSNRISASRACSATRSR